MRKLSFTQSVDAFDDLDLTPFYLYNLVQKRLEVFEYDKKEAKAAADHPDTVVHSAARRILVLRVGDQPLTTEEEDRYKERIQELENSTHMKLYKKFRDFLPGDAIACGQDFERQTHERVHHVGVKALLGDFLLVRVNGRYYRFNEHDYSYVGPWE